MSKQFRKQEKHSVRKDPDCQTHEIKVYTGLPPQVDGQIRCFCILSVPQVIWTVPKPPPGRAHVRVKWWGETGDGALFRPQDIKRGGKSQQNLTTAKYAVRSGPLQFATYLKDMGSLKLDVLTAPKSDVCGEAQVPKLGLLTSSKPINGSHFSGEARDDALVIFKLKLPSRFFPVLSKVGEKLANLQVSLVLEPVAMPDASDDQVPTTDPGLHSNWSNHDPMITQPGNYPSFQAELLKNTHPNYIMPSSVQQDQVRSMNNIDTTNFKVGLQTGLHQAVPEMSSYGAAQGNDLLSMIVDKGLKLREAMVKSSLNGDAAGAQSNPDAFSPTKLQMALMGSPKSGSEYVPSPFRNTDFKSEQTSISSDVSFDPAWLIVDPMMENSLLQDLFYAQAGSDPVNTDYFHTKPHFQSQLREQNISQPARLLGGSGPSQTDDPKEDMGNKRPPSRTSSLASLNLTEQEAASDGKKKRVKRKARSRSRSKSTTRSRSRSNSVPRSDSQSNTPRRSVKLTKKTSQSKENVSLAPKAQDTSKVKRKVRSRSSSRSRSRSRRRGGRASADESSEVELISSARSETSGVGTPSKTRACLSGDVLKHLIRIHFARVNIKHLQFSKSPEPSDFPGKHRNSRPPRPQGLKKAGTYIIEYHFPMTGSNSIAKTETRSSPSDYVTVPSQGMENETVIFGHKAVFPIAFDADTLDKWWNSALVFRLFHKESHGQAVLVGSGGISLKSILRSQNLSVEREIEIADGRRKPVTNSPRSSALNSSLNLFGQLKVSVLLASDPEQQIPQDLFDVNKDSNTIKSIEKTVDLPVSLRASSNNKRTVSGLPPQSPRPKAQEKLEPSQVKHHLKEVTENGKIALSPADFTSLQLQALIFVQEGHRAAQPGQSKNHMHGHGPLACNTYVICKMLWSKDSLHSDVCWGTDRPRFNFLQVTPVHLTAALLERLKDNHVIVEVWDRRTGPSGDKLMGMVKLSLQQFFLSFRDKKISKALLSSEYPVVAIDNFMPIVDPFSGLHVGQLKILLAMGSELQVGNLKTVALSMGDLYIMPGKAETDMAMSGMNQTQCLMPGKETHEFSVQIDGLSGLQLSDNMIWGEADCFIQFFFPAQNEDLKSNMATTDGPASLRCYRTVTTLCTPDAAFHDTSVHKLTLPVGVPIQRELLTACAKSSGCVRGLSFEVWCRYYQPNIRDQLIAKCVLPLAKLSAMITMHKSGEQCVQAFSLKLSQVGADLPGGDAESLTKPKNAGKLNFSITYRRQQLQSTLSTSPSSSTQDVCLSVGVLRACGLKSAAEQMAQFDSSMKYPADVGVNAYVRINVSLFGKENEKVTKTIAKSFAPEFSHSLDLSCPLIISGGQHNTVTSLAELLESGVATFEIWHQVAPSVYQDNSQRASKDRVMVQKLSDHSGDVLLGTCVVPLTSLLSRRTGLNGWFPINLPSLSWEGPGHVPEMPSDATLDQAVGGLELSVKFAHQDDRDRVIQAARNVGWSSIDVSSNQMDWDAEDNPTRSHNITVVIDHVSFPTELAIIKGETSVSKAARCYLRYKFYDKAAVMTKSERLRLSPEGSLVSTLEHKKDFTLSHTAPLQWYLREEKLEIQAWLTFGRDQDTQRSRPRDKWLGSCYVDLESLVGARRGRQRVSGLFPLFKPGTDNLKSAFIKADIVSRLSSSSSKKMNWPIPNICSEESDSVTETEQSMEEIELWAKNFTVDKSPTKKGRDGKQGFVDTGSFGVLLAIERAMHLPMVTERNRSGEVYPTTYVSYQSAERSKQSCTPIFPNTSNPTWDYAVETRLNSQYLHDANKNLVLKVWHKPADAPKNPDKSCDKVLGFVSVDLAPLSKGLQQICGWYNILDFNGQCRGQIKVSITPQDQQPVSVPSANSFMLPMFGRASTSLDSHNQTVADQLLSLQQQLKHWMASQTSKLFGSDGDVTATSNPTGLAEDSSNADRQTVIAGSSEPRPKLNLTTVSDDTPTSYLFSSLRRQLEDLDSMTQKMKLRLSTTSDSDTGQQPINSGRSADILNGTVSGLSTIHTASSLMNTRERFHAESSENGVSQELSHSRSINISTLEFPAEGVDKPEQKSDSAPSRKFLDSGVFSSKNFYDRSEDNDPDSQHSGRTVTLDPIEDQHLSTLSATRNPSQPHPTETLEMGSHSDTGGKTQPFVPAGDSSETSGNSHGFMPDSQRVYDTNTLTSINYFPASREADPAGAGTSSDAVSTLGSKHSRASGASGSLKSEHTVVYEDEDEYAGDDEDRKETDNSLFGSYHRYRALLDEEEEVQNNVERREEEEEAEEGGEMVEVVPRSLNNMSTVMALQANDDSDVQGLRSEKQATLSHASQLLTDLHHGNGSSCSGDNEDSFFQEVVSKPTNCRVESYEEEDVDAAVDQVQSLQISDVEDWLDKHVLDLNGENQQPSEDGLHTYITTKGNRETAQEEMRDMEDGADAGSSTSSLKRGGLRKPSDDCIAQDVRLDLDDGEEEATGDNIIRESIEVTGDVWRQDLVDSSDDETSTPRPTQPQSDKNIQEATNRLNNVHLAVDSKNDEISSNQMRCLSRVELENSSNSGESHRSATSATAKYGHISNIVNGVEKPDGNLNIGVGPSDICTTENLGFEYPFTLELDDMKPTVTASGGSRDHGTDDSSQASARSSSLDKTNPPLPSANSNDNQISEWSNPLDQTGDSWVTKEQSCENGGLDKSHIEADGHTERAENVYVETHVDTTVDSAYVDWDSCQPSSAGINTSSKGAASMYSFVQDDSGVGQLSRTMSRDSSRIKLNNFFMPVEDMKASLKVLQSATSEADSHSQKNLRAQQKVLATSQLVSKLAERRTTTSTSVKNKRPPTAQEAKRIAKIFTSRAS